MTFGSVCSGIEAASVAWERYGWKAAWFAEVDRAASNVLAYRYPDVVNHGDMTLLAAKVLSGEIDAPDILVGGTPCQAYSVAGRRQGLADARGQLTLSYVDLADAIDRVRLAAGRPPCIVVWENVPGVLTIKDNAFGCFLAGIAGEDDVLIPAGKKWTNAGAVFGPERAIAWRTIDAQFLGLAQRRRRVFVVASSREGFDPAAVLLEFEGVRRDSPPRRETGEGLTHPTAPRLVSSGRGVERTGDTRGQDPVVAVIRAGHGLSVLEVPRDEQHEARLAALRLVRGGSAGGVRRPAGVDADIVCMAHGQGGAEISVGARPTLTCNHEAPIIAFTGKDYGGDATNDLCPTLRSMGHDGSHANGGGQISVAYSVSLRGRDGGGTAELGGEVAGCLRASSGGGDKGHVLQAVCVTGDITHTLKAEGFDASEDGTGRGQPIVPTSCYRTTGNAGCYDTGDVTGALNTATDPNHHIVRVEMAVRRLMPVETERLQGFPDNWTLVPNAKGKPAADGPRYKQCGNSMAVAVMSWIGGRIKNHLDGLGHNGGPALDDFSDLLG
nr:DNA cytosine methyltransferase [Sphingomonas sp. TREG-RG-20F-R18-01]